MGQGASRMGDLFGDEVSSIFNTITSPVKYLFGNHNAFKEVGQGWQQWYSDMHTPIGQDASVADRERKAAAVKKFENTNNQTSATNSRISNLNPSGATKVTLSRHNQIMTKNSSNMAWSGDKLAGQVPPSQLLKISNPSVKVAMSQMRGSQKQDLQSSLNQMDTKAASAMSSSMGDGPSRVIASAGSTGPSTKEDNVNPGSSELKTDPSPQTQQQPAGANSNPVASEVPKKPANVAAPSAITAPSSVPQ